MPTATDTADITANLSAGRKRFLHSVFVNALEGGIGGWSECSTYRWSDGKGGDDHDGFHAVIISSELDEDDPDDNGWGVDGFPRKLRIDLAVIERGTRLFVRHCRGEIDTHGVGVPPAERRELPDDHYWRQFLAAEATHGREGDMDADVADNIVQFGLFEEVVYG
jgi:hypothetical protein